MQHPKHVIPIALPPKLVTELRELAREAARELVAEMMATASPTVGPSPEVVFMKRAVFAARIGVSLRTLDHLVDQGLPVINPGSRLVRIDVERADAWIAARGAR